MKIEFDTTSLSALDVKVLTLLAESQWPAADSIAPKIVPPVEARKASPAPKPVKDMNPDEGFDEPAPVVQEPTPRPAPAAEPEPAPAVQDEPEPPADVTMADAVAAATQLVSTGGAAKVKEALATVGAKRVSEVPPESLAAFVAALA